MPLAEWGADILAECRPIAAALDAAHGDARYAEALLAADAAMRHPALVPSARVLAAMATDFDNSYVRFTRAHSQRTKDALLRLPFSREAEARFRGLAQHSIEEQKRIEAADNVAFEDYRQRYLSAERLGLPVGSTIGS